MKNRIMIMSALFLLVSAVGAEDNRRQTFVPTSLQGDWAVNPKPSFNPQFRFPTPETSIRFTGTNYVYRMKPISGMMGGWDQDTGNAMTWVTDKDGTKYLEMTHYSVYVRTNSQPWQIDLWCHVQTGERKGQLIEKKGICEIQADTLKIKLSPSGGDRPTSFDGGGDLDIATRVEKAK